MLLHASCVDINHKGILLLGPSGSGKSDISLRLINLGGVLVSDDQVELQSRNGFLQASPPATIRGLLEVRGIGIIKIPFCSVSLIHLAVKLVPSQEVERMPEKQFYKILGHQIPLLSLCAFESSTPEKIKTFLNHIESFFLEKK